MAGLSKSMIDVGISMVLVDKFSNEAGRISGSFSSLMNDMNQWNRALTQQSANAFNVGREMVMGMYSAYEHSAGIYDQIFLTSKIAEATASQQIELLEKAQEVNLQTPLTNLDIASGERYLAMAGNSAERIKDMIGPAAELASIFSMSLGGKGGTADMMTNIMATFGVASEDAQEVSDILYKATTSANINLTDLAQSFQYAGSTFRNANIDMAMGASMIGVLGNQGIQASSAGTALANMIRYLTLSITGQKVKGKAMLDALGLTKEDLTTSYGDLKRMDEIMAILASRMKNLSGTAREVALYNIFGVRGARAANALLQDQWTGEPKLNEILAKTMYSNGSLHDAVDERIKTMQGHINTLISVVDNFKTAIGNVLATPITTLLHAISWLIKGVTELTKSGIGRLVVGITAGGLAVGVIVNGFKLVWNTLKMVYSMWKVVNGQATATSGALGAINTQASMLEQHLRHIVSLMAQMVATSSGGAILPGGVVLGKGQNGEATIMTKRGKTMAFTTYMEKGYAKGSPKNPAQPKVRYGTKAEAIAAATKYNSSKRFGTMEYQAAGHWWNPASYMWSKGLHRKYMFGTSRNMRAMRNQPKTAGAGSAIMSGLSTAAMIFGGPWGLLAGGIIGGVSALVSAYDDQTQAAKDQAEATRANTEALEKATNQQFFRYYLDRFDKAVSDIINSKFKNGEPIKLQINMNGVTREVQDGGTVDIDVNDLNY